MNILTIIGTGDTMTVDDEELMQQLQRASILMRRSRRARVKNRVDEPERSSERRCGHGHKGHHDGRDTVAFDDPDAMHGYGNHTCHGGSGRHGQNRILAILAMGDGTSQKDLAYLLGIRPQSLSEALDKLEESKLIERRHGSDDKRIVNVHLTEAGLQRARRVAEDRKKAAASIFSVLSEDEKVQFSTSMEKILASLVDRLSDTDPRSDAE